MINFGEHKKWMSPFVWMFGIICAFTLVILPNFGQKPDFFIEYNLWLPRMSLCVIVFSLVYFSPWFLNMATTPLLTLFERNKESWIYDLILMSITIFKALVFGSLLLIILLLLIPSFGGLL